MPEQGVVALWDVATGQQLAEYEAHEKRIWTVDFCHADPMHFISGSDDGWVKARTFASCCAWRAKGISTDCTIWRTTRRRRTHAATERLK